MSEKQFDYTLLFNNYYQIIQKDGKNCWRLAPTTIIHALRENEQLRQTMREVAELLSDEADIFSDKATEHDIMAYKELQHFDNKDAYYMCIAIKKAIKKLKGECDE